MITTVIMMSLTSVMEYLRTGASLFRAIGGVNRLMAQIGQISQDLTTLVPTFGHIVHGVGGPFENLRQADAAEIIAHESYTWRRRWQI